jgi:hypothetical protein
MIIFLNAQRYVLFYTLQHGSLSWCSGSVALTGIVQAFCMALNFVTAMNFVSFDGLSLRFFRCPDPAMDCSLNALISTAHPREPNLA